MMISVYQQGSVSILRASGRLDATTMADTERQLTAAIVGGSRRMVLDCSAVEYISSAGLRVILSAAKRMQKAEGKLVLAAASPQVRQVFDMAGLGAVIPVFETTDEASASLAPPVALPPPDQRPFTFAEEIYLLALDDERGVLKTLPAFALEYALAGALLMELALDGRVDADLATLKVVSTVPTGDALLDDTLQVLQQEKEAKPVSFWLDQLTRQTVRTEDRVLARLVGRGVLRQENRRVLWVFEVRRYPLVDNREVKEVRARLRELILGDEIPDPRDIVLVSLGNACRLLDDMFAPDERDRVAPRIETLARLDLIGQEMGAAIQEIERTMAQAMAMM
ncbi:MAG: anti-sigma factor antagonist [Lentisphaeria bacterium]|jgi:anti-anti-sigma factor|nr:anti-sigma factor antagonist [Lentisphaeria bacterium]